MESFYELAFPDVDFNLDGDTLIACPFPHSTPSGETYYETNPSMSINIDKGIYHCFSCGRKGNELQFIADYMDLDIQKAAELKSILEEAKEDTLDWQNAVELLNKNPEHKQEIINKYKISEEVIDELQIGLEGPGKGIAFPVFLFGKLVDVITYNPGQKPKYRKRLGSKNGMIMPYDIWRDSTKHTLVVAGQKDLAIARSKNLNAIAITGGEGEIPELLLNEFKDRKVFIAFDNDTKGIEGAKKLASRIKPYADTLKVLDLSDTCTEKGEDLWDFFVKYRKTKKDLLKIINKTKEFTEEDLQKEKEKVYPTVSLSEAIKNTNINKTLRSNIQVIATEEDKFLMPTAVKAEKVAVVSDSEVKNKLKKGQKTFWHYGIRNAKDMFYLIDSNLKEYQIQKNLRGLLGIPKEEGMKVTYNAQETIYKSDVTDYFEASNLDDMITEFTAYSVGQKLESGKKYKITYKLVPHPQKGNTLNMVIFDVEQSEDSVSNFKINKQVKENLNMFQVENDLEETVNNHIEKVKGIVDADFDDMLLKLIDLWFNTPLMFNVGNKTKMRAYLDMLIIAESRVGKSTTVEALQKTYGLGTIIPLNGNNASVAGIIGGSHKTGNGFQIRAGVIPRSHKGAVILEELVKAKSNLLQELTEVRSSYKATITRVSGTINLPAYVRMLSLTNTKADGTSPKPISSYPNGLEIVIDLVGTAEDIARYDVIGVLPGRGAQSIDPFFEPDRPFPTSAYRDRIRWIWSREPHQIIIDKETYIHTVNHANKLNKDFDTYIKLFGTEAWLKILRLATSIAGYVASTDETYENIIVDKFHVDLAVKILRGLYDNKTFRLKQFVEEERKYREVDKKSIDALQSLWQENSAVIKHLESTSKTTQRNLLSVSGLDHSSFNIITNKLTVQNFIRYETYDIIPTEKFRKAVEKIDRNVKNRTISI